MYFTKDELEDIYETYLDRGVIDNQKVLIKINTEYTYCSLCNHLIPNAEYQQHFDDHE